VTKTMRNRHDVSVLCWLFLGCIQ